MHYLFIASPPQMWEVFSVNWQVDRYFMVEEIDTREEDKANLSHGKRDN
jgi:hypothetical protein